MKTLLIETVSNGWIVRPFQPSASWACTELPVIAVYTNLTALQDDLPKLLAFDGFMNATKTISEPTEFINVGPDSAPF